ncbi:MAG: hypothetical protein NZ524_04220 [Thiobacillaceae bacterium]|nr:hypothetical protein [Thiobacillaceae bacterium]MCX7672727.1 hypothetical protein [Thiobacillaceae bacterium]MDW8324439.1 hypothetical protein [Burkholderiales bacterium]
MRTTLDACTLTAVQSLSAALWAILQHAETGRAEAAYEAARELERLTTLDCLDAETASIVRHQARRCLQLAGGRRLHGRSGYVNEWVLEP